MERRRMPLQLPLPAPLPLPAGSVAAAATSPPRSPSPTSPVPPHSPPSAPDSLSLGFRAPEFPIPSLAFHPRLLLWKRLIEVQLESRYLWYSSAFQAQLVFSALIFFSFNNLKCNIKHSIAVTFISWNCFFFDFTICSFCFRGREALRNSLSSFLTSLLQLE
jgi:hypothetical protein